MIVLQGVNAFCLLCNPPTHRRNAEIETNKQTNNFEKFFNCIVRLTPDKPGWQESPGDMNDQPLSKLWNPLKQGVDYITANTGRKATMVIREIPDRPEHFKISPLRDAWS